jgi:hypothetical protein
LKWWLALVAMVGSLVAMLGGRIRWKGRAQKAQQEAEEARLQGVGLCALMEKEKILAELEKKRALDNDERVRLALVRAAIRRANDGSTS